MKTQRLESLIELATVLARQSDYQEILRLVTQKSAAMLRADTALVMMVNPSTYETIKTLYQHGEEPEKRAFQLLHTYLTGWVIENDKGFIAEDLPSDRRFRSELLEGLPVKSVICEPFRGDSAVIGTLLLINHTEQVRFNQDNYDFLQKFVAIASPFLWNIQQVQTYFAIPVPEETLVKKYEAHGLLGRSEPFIGLLQSIEAAAVSDVRVLLEGESGTGKELVARAIHNNSSRASGKFVAFDCGAIPRDLIESELFGHLKGAFTGAGESRKGLMEEAHRGTLFMDEITNLPLDVQVKFLRVLQEKEIRPLGSNQAQKIDVRIIAAASASLRTLVEQKQFREDLFFRLYVYPIGIPLLDERRKDIPLLANHFLKRFAEEQNKQVRRCSDDLMAFFKNHHWAGNIRELENLVERLIVLAPRETETLESKILPEEYRNELKNIYPEPSDVKTSGSLREIVAAHERQVIEKALEQSGWNQSMAARMLQISEHAIRYKMKKLGITRQD